jgi:phenylacetate-CoA ligase
MVPGVRWPALLAGRAASLAAFLAQLERTQWLSPEELEALQLAQLESLLAHACRNAPAWRERLGAVGITAEMPLTREAWERIPVLERAELQDGGERWRSTAFSETHGEIAEIATSGSTGRPVRVLKTALTGFFWDAITLRAHEWADWDAAGRLGAIKWYPDGVASYPDGLPHPDWGSPYSMICHSGPSCALSISATIAQQAEWLARLQPDYLTVFPTLLPDLIRECAGRGLQLTQLRQLRTIGESLDSATRALCRERWQVGVQDVYSAQEVGYIALQCPAHEHYHVQSECVRVEVLDQNGAACGPGQTGRVVVTALHNFAMPLVRYAIGDYAEVGTPCPCGRGLPVLRRILGRVRNMIALPDGTRRWPSLAFFEGSVQEAVKQYQCVQRSLTGIELRLVVARPLAPEEESALRAQVGKVLGHPFDVTITYHEGIPRSAGGKYEQFMSQLDT